MRKLVPVLVVLAACGGPNEGGALSACEQFVERRVNAEVEFDSEATVEALEDGWYVRSRFDSGEGVVTYECTVTHDGAAWTLEELTTDR